MRDDTLSRWILALAGLIFVAPSITADLVALLIASPVITLQVLARRRMAVA